MAQVILIDFHGVLTDGKLNITHDGKTFFESCHTRDVRAIRELIARGWEVYIVTASSNPIVEAFCKKVGALIIHARDKSDLGMNDYIAIGDDAWDIPMLKNAKEAYCPCDADTEVLCLPGINILGVKGGHGLIASLVRRLLTPVTVVKSDEIVLTEEARKRIFGQK
jgi:3-deoxy-D-manno-octulosonate 8-phosphate phosphatase KdsC-like HAD superfamily phosphatase